MTTNMNGARHCRRSKSAAGFSYIEALIGLGIIVFAMAVALTFFLDLGATLHTESDTLATQQTGRLAVDEISRSVRQAGYGVRRSDGFNAASWQASIVHASSHTLAFNADIDNTIGNLSNTVTLSFPLGPDYTGEGATSISGAETYVYTLDANGDGTLDADDRSQAASGSYNPAGETPTPHDFAVFRRIHGWNGTDNGGALEPLAPFLFTNATSDSVYPEGGSPEPLFRYWLTEDLDGNGELDDAECANDAVASCPPSSAREPLLYLWGDSDFDGELSESEKTTLLTLEVGSAAWDKNPLVDGGSYVSTTLTQAVVVGTEGAYSLKVADASKFPPGSHVLIGSGGSAERRYVDSTVTTSPEMLLLTTPSAEAHAVGTTVQALPSTMVRAIRSIGITYSAITGRQDSDGAYKAIGRAGRQGTRGLDYRVMPFQREVEVINAPTVALSQGTPPGGGGDVCPLFVVNACSEDDHEQTARFTNLAGQNKYKFLVTDEGGAPVPGVKVSLSNDDPALGVLSSATLTSDASGFVEVTYNMTGALGEDEITASTTCVSDAGVIEQRQATLRVDLYQLSATLTPDCLSTVSSNVPKPQASFTVGVTSGDGPVGGQAVNLSLDFDPAYLPATPDFLGLVGGIEVGGISLGTTDSNGVLAAVGATTQTNGQIAGTAGLVSDTPGNGARLRLKSTIPTSGCATVAGELTKAVTFFDLALDSLTPYSGCTTYSPCTISTGMQMPSVRGTLTLNDQPVAGSALTFTTKDTQVPGFDPDKGASVVSPAGPVTTNVSGQGQVKITNNGAAAITAFTPLVTQVSVTSTGDPSLCTSATIQKSGPDLEFEFEIPANLCDAKMTQSLISKVSDKIICDHSQNGNDLGGCDQILKGIRVTVYKVDGVTPDPAATVKVKKIEGGAVTTSASCSATGKVTLFEDKCLVPNRVLNNGEQWLFKTFSSCKLPPAVVGPESYFTFSRIEFNGNYPKGRNMDIELTFACSNTCDPATVKTKVFKLKLPST